MNIQFSPSELADLSTDLLAIAAGPGFEEELSALNETFGGHLLGWLKAKKFKGKSGSACTFPVGDQLQAKSLMVIGVADRSDDDLRAAAGTAALEARNAGHTRLALAFGDLSDDTLAQVLEGAAIGNYRYQTYKPADDQQPDLEDLVIVGSESAEAVARAAIRGKWQKWSRDLVNAPPADLYPEVLAQHVRELAVLPHVTVEVWDMERCQKEGCVGIIAVGQGSSRPPCLIHARYAPPKAQGHVALVGKGVTFDSGGLSIKSSAGMQIMRCDMGGAATVLGAFAAAAELEIPVAIDCFVGSVENMVDGTSYKLGDILRYTNGVTVEIHNTDAEGRLVLADCLIRACAVEGVTHVVDAATLTGASLVALGPHLSALFTKDDALADGLLSAASANGDGLWRLPLHQAYRARLKSEYAQIKNVGGREAGAITAALYLQHFVTDDVSWAHLDIAGPAFAEKPHSIYRPGGTGQMVRSLVSWIGSFAS